jgi:hypothetical protein
MRQILTPIRADEKYCRLPKSVEVNCEYLTSEWEEGVICKFYGVRLVVEHPKILRCNRCLLAEHGELETKLPST